MRRFPELCGITAAALLLLGMAGCRENRNRPNVLLITLDTQRADHIGILSRGRSMALTPNIDALAGRGVVFPNAYSPIPITLPAHAALFYSRPPHRLPLYNNGQILEPPPGGVTLAENFRRKGFRTAAFVSLGVLQARFGLQAGFESYRDEMPSQRWYLNAAEVNQRVFAWLEGIGRQRFFLWIHYSDPHDPYAPPDTAADLRIHLNGRVFRDLCLQRRENLSLRFPLRSGENRIRFEILRPFPHPRDDFRASLNDVEFQSAGTDPIIRFEGMTELYRGEARILAIPDSGGVIRVTNPEGEAELQLSAQGNLNLFPSESAAGYRRETEYLDHQIGRLLTKLKELDLESRSLIFLAGDHGEGLGEYLDPRGEVHFGHIHYLQDVYVRIPMVLVDPFDRREGLRIADPVTLIDIAPTLLDRMGWQAPADYAGRSLLDPRPNPERKLEFETYTPEAAHDSFALLEPPWRLIFTPATREFRLYDLKTDPRETENIYPKLSGRPQIQDLTRRLVERARAILAEKTDLRLDERSREMLRSLGYIK